MQGQGDSSIEFCKTSSKSRAGTRLLCGVFFFSSHNIWVAVMKTFWEFRLGRLVHKSVLLQMLSSCGVLGSWRLCCELSWCCAVSCSDGTRHCQWLGADWHWKDCETRQGAGQRCESHGGAFQITATDRAGEASCVSTGCVCQGVSPLSPCLRDCEEFLCLLQAEVKVGSSGVWY